MSERLKYPLIITLICLAAATALALAFALTRENIAASKRSELQAGLETVLPARTQSVEEVPLADGGTVYVARELAGRKGKALGYATIGVEQGYSSKIKVLVGVDLDMKIVAIRILEQQETPGLGERTREVPAAKSIWGAIRDLFTGGEDGPAREPQFQKQFRNKTESRLVLVKEQGSKDNISQLTGATITSRAVLTAVRQAVQTIKTNLPEK